MHDKYERIYQRLFLPLWIIYLKFSRFFRSSEKKKKEIYLRKEILSQLEKIDSSNTNENIRWNSFVKVLRDEINSNDILSFLNWRIIRDTMFCIPNQKELLYLRKHNWSKWKNLIEEDSFGKPPPYITYLKSSGNRIHHIYHIARFEKLANRKMDDYDVIIEFGGGYGSMCRLIYNAGFSGKYIIFDFPEFSILQNIYLRETRKGLNEDIVYVNTKTDLIRNLTENKKVLFIGMWSISETDIRFREEILNVIDSYADTLFVAFQDRFGEIDNEGYFRNYIDKHLEFEWSINTMIEDSKTKNKYLIGKRK